VNFPIYIYYELLIRLSEIIPETGDYVSNILTNEYCILRTTNGTINIPLSILQLQFDHPEQIGPEHLKIIANGFKANYL
jgi:hypothetical protein